jgi:prevent-host-death family protein
MTIKVNIAEAKAKLSALIEAAERGEVVIIARAGQAVATLRPIAVQKIRPPGSLRRLGWEGPPTPLDALRPDPADAEAADRPLASSVPVHR